MNNELIERIDAILNPPEFLDNGAAIAALLHDCKAALSQHSEEAALLRSKIDTLHRLMVTAEKRGASQEAEPVASVPQDVEYQYRIKPVWAGATQPWTEWKPCSVEQARDYLAVPILHDWLYEVKAICPCSNQSSSQDVEEFIVENELPAFGGDSKVFTFIRASTLRAWMAGHARVPVDRIVSTDRSFVFDASTQIHTPFVTVNFGPSDWHGRDAFSAIIDNKGPT